MNKQNSVKSDVKMDLEDKQIKENMIIVGIISLMFVTSLLFVSLIDEYMIYTSDNDFERYMNGKTIFDKIDDYLNPVTINPNSTFGFRYIRCNNTVG